MKKWQTSSRACEMEILSWLAVFGKHDLRQPLSIFADSLPRHLFVHMPLYINGRNDNAVVKPSLRISDQLLCYRKKKLRLVTWFVTSEFIAEPKSLDYKSRTLYLSR